MLLMKESVVLDFEEKTTRPLFTL